MPYSDYNWVTKVNASSNPSGVTISMHQPSLTSARGKIAPHQNFYRTVSPALEKVADYIRMRVITRTFQQEGPGWRPLAMRTRAERKAQGYNPEHPILFRTGDLFKELTEKTHPKHVQIIKVTNSSATVTIEGSSEKFKRNQYGDATLKIPARPMVPGKNKALSIKDQRAISAIMAENIQKAVMRQNLARGNQ